MSPELLALTLTAASIGFVHTLAGPDHYVPFVALARARNWSVGKTLGVTLSCGVGHVASSVLLGGLGLALGWAVAGMERFEGIRGDLAGWLLLALGLGYAGWGVHRARRGHVEDHHHHPRRRGTVPRGSTPWFLFLVFVFGPCEPLIPVLMVPAARGSAVGVVWITFVFAAATLATMSLAVLLGLAGVSRLRLEGAERWAHALAGAALALCGTAVVAGL